jgi:hypothetical protein
VKDCMQHKTQGPAGWVVVWWGTRAVLGPQGSRGETWYPCTARVPARYFILSGGCAPHQHESTGRWCLDDCELVTPVPLRGVCEPVVVNLLLFF